MKWPASTSKPPEWQPWCWAAHSELRRPHPQRRSPAPSELAAPIKRNADGSLPQRGGVILKGATRAAPSAAPSLGWNFEVCTASYVSSPNAFAFTVFARNADGTVFFESTSSTTDPVQNELVAACQHAGG